MTTNLTGKLVLLAEDQALVGICLSDGFQEFGMVVAGPFQACSEAMDWLKGKAPDAAVLDVLLRDGPSTPLAEELSKRGVPFLVFSGTPQDSTIEPVLASAAWIEKPASMEHLVAALQKLLQGKS